MSSRKLLVLTTVLVHLVHSPTEEGSRVVPTATLPALDQGRYRAVGKRR